MPCSRCQNHYFWWLWSGCSPLPIPNREVKPRIADDTALVCGKVGRRQSFYKSIPIGMLFFFAQVPRLGSAYAATFRQCSSKLGTALNFRSFHHGRGALQLADEDLLHWIRFNSAVLFATFDLFSRCSWAYHSSPYGVPPGGRRTLRRHRAQCQTALRRLQETLGDVNLHRHTKMTKAEASYGLGFLV